jgi:hypothetical protein
MSSSPPPLHTYYRFEAPQAERKDEINKDDLQEAARKVNRDRFANPLKTLQNAHQLGMLDKGSEKATFTINSVGENLVAMTLPGTGTNNAKPKKPAAKSGKKAAKAKKPAQKAWPVTESQVTIDAAIAAVNRLQSFLKRQTGKQVSSDDEKQIAKATALAWFNNHRSVVAASSGMTS